MPPSGSPSSASPSSASPSSASPINPTSPPKTGPGWGVSAAWSFLAGIVGSSQNAWAGAFKTFSSTFKTVFDVNLKKSGVGLNSGLKKDVKDTSISAAQSLKKCFLDPLNLGVKNSTLGLLGLVAGIRDVVRGQGTLHDVYVKQGQVTGLDLDTLKEKAETFRERMNNANTAYSLYTKKQQDDFAESVRKEGVSLYKLTNGRVDRKEVAEKMEEVQKSSGIRDPEVVQQITRQVILLEKANAPVTGYADAAAELYNNKNFDKKELPALLNNLSQTLTQAKQSLNLDETQSSSLLEGFKGDLEQAFRFTGNNPALIKQFTQGDILGRAYEKRAGLDNFDISKKAIEAVDDKGGEAAKAFSIMHVNPEELIAAMKTGGDAVPKFYQKFMDKLGSLSKRDQINMKPVWDSLGTGVDFETIVSKVGSRLQGADKELEASYGHFGEGLAKEADFVNSILGDKIKAQSSAFGEKIKHFVENSKLSLYIDGFFKDLGIDWTTITHIFEIATPLVILFESSIKRLGLTLIEIPLKPFKFLGNLFKSFTGVAGKEGEEATVGLAGKIAASIRGTLKGLFSGVGARLFGTAEKEGVKASSGLFMKVSRFFVNILADGLKAFGRIGEIFSDYFKYAWGLIAYELKNISFIRLIGTRLSVVSGYISRWILTILTTASGWISSITAPIRTWASGILSSMSSSLKGTFLSKLGNLGKGMFGEIGDVLKQLGGKLWTSITEAVGIGGAAEEGEGLLGGLLKNSGKFLGSLAGKLAGSLGGLAEGMFGILEKLNPIALIFTVVAGYFQIGKAKDKIKASVNFAGQTIGGLLGFAVGGPIGALIGTLLGGFLSKFLEKPVRDFLEKNPKVSEALSKFGNWIKDIGDKAMVFLGGLWKSIKKIDWGKVLDVITGAFSSFWNFLKPIIAVVVPALIATGKTIWRFIDTSLIQPFKTLLALFKGSGTKESTGGFGKWLTMLRDKAVEISNFVLPIIFRFVDWAGRAIGGLFKWLIPVLSKYYEIITAIVAWLADAILATAKVLYAAFNAILPWIGKAFDWLVKIFRKYIEPYLINTFKSILDWGVLFGKWASKNLPEFLDQTIDVLGAFVDSFGTSMSVLFKTWDYTLEAIADLDAGFHHLQGSIWSFMSHIPGWSKLTGVTQEQIDAEKSYVSPYRDNKIGDETIKSLANLHTAKALHALIKGALDPKTNKPDTTTDYGKAQKQTNNYLDDTLPTFGKEVGKPVWDAGVGVVKGVGKKIEGGMKTAYDWLKEKAPETKEQAVSYVIQGKASFSDILSQTKDKFGETSPQYLQALKRINPILASFEKMRHNIMASTGIGFKKIIGGSTFEGMKKGFGSALDWIKDKMSKDGISFGGVNGPSNSSNGDSSSTGQKNSEGYNITSGGPMGQKVSAAAIAMNPSGANLDGDSEWHRNCQVKAREAFRKATGYRHSAFGLSAADTMNNFKSKGIGYAWTGKDTPIPVGALVYSSGRVGNGSGHVQIMGSDGMFHDQYGAHPRPKTRPDWIVPSDGLSRGAGGKVSDYNAQNYIGGSVATAENSDNQNGTYVNSSDKKVKSFQFSDDFKKQVASDPTSQREVRNHFGKKGKAGPAAWAKFYQYYGDSRHSINVLANRIIKNVNEPQKDLPFEQTQQYKNIQNKYRISRKSLQKDSENYGLISQLTDPNNINLKHFSESNDEMSNRHADRVRRSYEKMRLKQDREVAKARQEYNGNNFYRKEHAQWRMSHEGKGYYGQWGTKTIKGKRRFVPNKVSSDKPSVSDYQTTGGAGSGESLGGFDFSHFGLDAVGKGNLNKYVGVIEASSKASGVPGQLLASVMAVESHFKNLPLNSAGAGGIAQFKPSTLKEYGGGTKVMNIKASIMAEGRMYAHLIKKYSASKYQGKGYSAQELATAAYNNGEKGFEDWWNSGRSKNSPEQRYITKLRKVNAFGGGSDGATDSSFPSSTSNSSSKPYSPGGMKHVVLKNDPNTNPSLSSFRLNSDQMEKFFGQSTEMGQRAGTMTNFGIGNTIQQAYSSVPSSMTPDMNPVSLNPTPLPFNFQGGIGSISSPIKPDATLQDIVDAIHSQTKVLEEMDSFDGDGDSDSKNPVKFNKDLPAPALPFGYKL